MRRTALIASILALLAACDKAPDETPVAGTPLTDLSASPTVLFQVFGDRTAPRAVPIAVLVDGALRPLTLDADGWRLLDSLVFSAGDRLTLYHRGADVGSAVVTRGMWPAGEDALYSLPGCQQVVPQAVLRLEATVPIAESVEMIASSVPLTQIAPGRPFPNNAAAQGRTLTNAIAAEAQIAPEEIGHLDFSSRWLLTGAGAERRTLLTSVVDPEAGDAGPGAGHTTTIFALAEDSAGVFNTSFRHTASGESRTVDFLRLVNHADLDGDGVTELLMESWRYARVPDLMLLRYREGRWRETFRVSMEWCLDGAK
jgi:hypothetical protein